MSAVLFAGVSGLSQERASRLVFELRTATEATDRKALKGWAKRCGALAAAAGLRRIRLVGRMLRALARWLGFEAWAALKAAWRRELRNHVRARVAAGSGQAGKSLRQSADAVAGMIRLAAKNPADAGVQMMVAVFGFYLGGGGLDGDGGIPDLDLEFGIGAHRSIFSHSVLAGVAAEVLLLGLVDLAKVLADRLPADHDPLWDALIRFGERTALSLGLGLSAGVAYHLFVDAGIQPASYKDLPVSMSMDAHKAVFGANAAVEAAATATRNEI